MQNSIKTAPSQQQINSRQAIIESRSEMMLEPIQTSKTQYSTHIQEENMSSEKLDNNAMVKVEAIIERASAKAVLLRFQDNNKIWVPKSKIQSQYDENIKSFQTFLIPNWIMSA